MSSFPWIGHVSVQTWLAIGAVVILLGLLLVVRVTRERNVVIPSATADMIAYHLSRIADALDKGALERGGTREPVKWREASAEVVHPAEPREKEAPPAVPVPEGRSVGLSMFGR